MKIDTRIPIVNGDFYLGPLLISHAASWYEYLTDERVNRYTSWNLQNLAELEELVHFYNSGSPGGAVRFGVFSASTHELVGTVGLHSFSIKDGRAEIAYDVRPDFWRQGIARAACGTLAGLALGKWKLQRVQATLLDENIGSAKVLQRCGFEFEGVMRKYRVLRGVARDYHLYSRVVEA
ncbi:GNAT family N-acetyltransferase [Pseudomonas chlororaphis]|uniref:GNAT family N-acetyltransferase n=1 Tax=Pseudomonas chlororaphis TaxID=587753 RepID=UPI00352AB1AE